MPRVVKQEPVEAKEENMVTHIISAPEAAVIHPTGVWLPTLAQTKDQAKSISVIDGVEVPRASWKANLQPFVQRASAVASAVLAGATAVATGLTGSARPNFKLFCKADSQMAPASREYVSCTTWVPTAGRSNLDAFASQPSLEVESQIPHVNM